MKKFPLVLIVTILIFSLISPSISNAEASSLATPKTNKNVENFVIEILEEDADGLVNVIGYKEVNSATEATIEENKISTKISVIEDHYNLNGQYLKTLIKSEEFINDLETGKALANSQEKELNEPLTMLTNNFTGENVTSELTVNETKEVSALIDEQVKLLPETKYIEVQGFTHEKLNEIKKVATEASLLYENQIMEQAAVTPQSNVLRAGAFDNFYNINTYNNDYHVQALGASPNLYLIYNGKTTASTNTSSSVNKFKGYIDNYETNIMGHMQGATFWEVAGWWANIAGLVGLVAGYAAGPAGWLGIVANYAGAFSLFIGLTSSTYATYSRMQYSKNAAQYLESARQMLFYGGNYFDKSTFSTVKGY